MTMPGYDLDIMEGKQFHYHDVVEKKYYSLNLTGMKSMHEFIDAKGYKAVIDSGTSLIVGPHSLIKPMLEGIVVDSDCSNVDRLPNLSFIIDDVEYSLEPNDYVLRLSQGG